MIRFNLSFAAWSRAADANSLPAIRAWLRQVDAIVQPEVERRMRNLLLYGTSHPELFEHNRRDST